VKARSAGSKFGNVKTVVDGLRFDSKKEAKRWTDLKLLEKTGMISDLQRQVRIELVPKGPKNRAVHYVADFTYKGALGEIHVEDVKGYRTDVYKLKRALFAHRYQMEIEEV
jgi:hypothetical protein